jgi:uncharacterized protein DUF4382
MRPYKATSIAVVLLCAGAFACSGTNTPATPSTASNATSSGGGGGNPTSSTAGALSIYLTDSPFSDAKALLVTFSEVSVHSADTGEWKTLPFTGGSSRTCDLKRLNGPTDVLGVGSLPAGKYTQVRLNVTAAAIYFDAASTSASACAPQIAAPSGKNAPVDIPSGEVKLNNEFTVASTGTTMVLDFDGDQSVRQTGSGNGNGNGNGNSASNTKYMMVPVIRVVSVQ